LNENLRDLIDKSVHGNGDALHEWLALKAVDTSNNCWERNNCGNQSCPAWGQRKCRCWLVSGTLCDGAAHDVISEKFRSCLECPVYKDAVSANPVKETEEHLIVLVHALARKQEELNSLATTDYLTGLHNRRYFDLLIPSEIELMIRNMGVIYITVLDIDDFKLANDTYGHLVGDKILQACASILSAATRKSDLLVRFGGDEFLIASNCADNDENCAEITHQRILERLETWNQEHPADGLAFSISLGHSVMKEGVTLEAAITEADRRMYQNKNLKRSLLTGKS
jgi:diguanylate cyclase (GGDEF)-like protein